MELKDFLKSCRRRAGLTQKQEGDALGVYRETVTAWETGTQNPTWENITKVAALAQVPISACLVLPSDPKTRSQDEAAIETMRDAISRGGDFRRHVIEQAEVLRTRAVLDVEKKKR